MFHFSIRNSQLRESKELLDTILSLFERFQLIFIFFLLLSWNEAMIVFLSVILHFHNSIVHTLNLISQYNYIRKIVAGVSSNISQQDMTKLGSVQVVDKMLIIMFSMVILSVFESTYGCTYDQDCYPDLDYCSAGFCYNYVNYVPYFGIGGGLFALLLICLLIWFFLRRQRINRQQQNIYNIHMARAIRGQPNYVNTVGQQVVVQPTTVFPVYQDQPTTYSVNGYVRLS